MSDIQGTHQAVTLRDIAKDLGVSHVTVSLALREHAKIPVQKRRQIQQRAREMGYFPNATALALSHHKRGAKEARAATLGWLNLWPDVDTWRHNDEALRYWQGAFPEAERLGYCLDEVSAPSSLSSEELAHRLLERNISGLLVPPQPPKVALWNDFAWAHFPAVRLGRGGADSPLPTVASDDVNNAATVFARVWDHGYRRIGLALDSNLDHGSLSKAGFLYARSILDNAPALPPLELTGKTGSGLRRRLDEWFARNEPDVLVLEHLEQLRQLGAVFEPPPSMGIVLLDVPKGCENGFAGIRRHAGEVGRVAVQHLAAQISARGDASPLSTHHFLVEGTWIDGPSLPVRGEAE